MKTNIIKFLGIAFLATTILSACSGSSSNPTPTPTPTNTDPTCSQPTVDVKLARTQVVGVWKWVQSEISGRAGTTIETPASTSSTRSYNFKEEGTVDYSENGKIVNTYDYTVTVVDKNNMVLTFTLKGATTDTYTIASCSQSLKLTLLNSSFNAVHLYNK
jgi:hypothetical protein